jgi:hypothetical protein
LLRAGAMKDFKSDHWTEGIQTDVQHFDLPVQLMRSGENTWKAHLHTSCDGRIY